MQEMAGFRAEVVVRGMVAFCEVIDVDFPGLVLDNAVRGVSLSRSTFFLHGTT